MNHSFCGVMALRLISFDNLWDKVGITPLRNLLRGRLGFYYVLSSRDSCLLQYAISPIDGARGDVNTGKTGE